LTCALTDRPSIHSSQAKWEHDDLLLEASADLTEQSQADLGTSFSVPSMLNPALCSLNDLYRGL
jgi:hypothetical protein